MAETEHLPQILTPSSSGRRSIGVSNSPEFEFWMATNSSNFPQPHNLLSADELFSDGILLPLHLLHLSDPTPANDPEPSGSDQPEPESETPVTEPSAQLSASGNSSLTSSKRWRDIFKKSDKKIETNGQDHGVRETKKREKKSSGGGVTAAELNINIWPFSRSRSGGAARPRAAVAPPRNVSSAPCSRSNSAGESKSRKWPSSPGRGAGGVHLGRSSPVWQVRRGGAAGGRRSTENEGRRKIPFPGSGSGSGGGGCNSKGRVLSLNVPMCIGYRQNLRCGSEESGGGGGAGLGGGVSGEGVRGGNLFNIKTMFTKKVF